MSCTVHLIYKDSEESIRFFHIDELLSHLLCIFDDGDITDNFIGCHAENGVIGNEELRELLAKHLEEREADLRHKYSLAAGDEKL